MKKKLNLLSLIMCILWMSNVYSQEVQVQLIDTGIGQFQSILISDFDFLEIGGSEELFKVIITNTTQTEYSNAVLRFELWEGPVNAGTLLARIVTEGFTIPGEMRSWEVTNTELANKMTTDFGFVIRIAESGLESDANDLRDEVMATSQLPTGVYNLAGTLTIPGLNDATDSPIPIIISNPTMLNLVAPGMLINSGFKYEVYTENPLFQWNGNSGDYKVVVFKKRHDFDTIDDILNSVPVWESELLHNLSVQYPVGGAVPLEYGSDYVWQVYSYINADRPSRQNVIKSELWEFTVVDPSKSNLTQETIAKQELEQILRQLLGDNAETIIRQINDYDLTSMRVNGSGISVPELYQLLEKYRDQEHDVYDLILRSSN